MGIARSRPIGEQIKLIRVKHNPKNPTAWTTFRLLGGEEVLDTHYVPGRGTMPHLEEHCPWCTPQSRIRSLAYLPCLARLVVLGESVIGPGLLELPAVVAAEIPQPRRGRMIEVLRAAGDKDHYVRLVEQQVAQAPGSGVIARTLPEPCDTIETLLRIWGLRREDIESPGEIEQPDVIRFRKQA